jgi:hypothetical protein
VDAAARDPVTESFTQSVVTGDPYTGKADRGMEIHPASCTTAMP